MIVLMKSTIELTEAERMELSQRATSRSGRADDGRRARLILLLEAGHSWAQIRGKLDCNDAFIDRWSKRFGRERLAGLFNRHAGRGASKLTPALEARILDWTLKPKPAAVIAEGPACYNHAWAFEQPTLDRLAHGHIGKPFATRHGDAGHPGARRSRVGCSKAHAW